MSTFIIGDRVVIEGRGGGWDGVTGTIASIGISGSVYGVVYDYPETLPGGRAVHGPSGSWSSEFLLVIGGGEASSGTLRGSLPHITAREYAERSKSAKLLTPEQNGILQAAADGEEVDVYAFRKAATAALSAASTRAGQSTARREYAKWARHLIHWADALVDNHVKGLPIYEKGERSPKLQEARQNLALLKAEKQDLQATIDADRAQWEADTVQLGRALKAAQEASSEVYADFGRVEVLLAYAVNLLDDKSAARLAGYADGLGDDYAKWLELP